MTTIQLESFVKDQFSMGLYEFIKDKVEVENLYDYELAGILAACHAKIQNLPFT